MFENCNIGIKSGQNCGSRITDVNFKGTELMKGHLLVLDSFYKTFVVVQILWVGLFPYFLFGYSLFWDISDGSSNLYLRRTFWPWSSWTANIDKKLNVNKPCVSSQKTAFRFLKLSSFPSLFLFRPTLPYTLPYGLTLHLTLPYFTS